MMVSIGLFLLIIIIYCLSLWSETKMPDTWYLTIIENRLSVILPDDSFQNIWIDYRASRDFHMEVVCSIKDPLMFEGWYRSSFGSNGYNYTLSIQDYYPILSEEMTKRIEAILSLNSCLWYESNERVDNRNIYNFIAYNMETNELIYVGHDK